MWQCPNCGREFDVMNQNHFCSVPPKTVNEYIALQPEKNQPFLYRVRDILRTALPEAQECISWQMPTYRAKRNIIHFAGFKKHIGIYPGPTAVEAFAARLNGYKTSKGAIQLPYDKPLPSELIADIAKWCYETGNHP